MTTNPPVAPWFQPKTKQQYAIMMAVLVGLIVVVWVVGLGYLKHGMPAPVIQKARNLFEDKKYDEAVAILTEAIRDIEKNRGPEDTFLVKHFDLLASIYVAMKKDADAETYWRRSYEIRKKNLGADHAEVIGSGDKLALSLQAQGKFEEAETLLKKSLAHREAAWSVDDDRLIPSLNRLAELYIAQKKFDAAEPYAQRALKLGRTKMGLRPPAMGDSLLALGAIAASREKYDEAIPLYREGINDKFKQLPPAAHIPPKPGQISHGDFADLCRTFAGILRKAGKEAEAKEMDAKAEETLKPKE